MRLDAYVKNYGNYTEKEVRELQSESRILLNGKKELLACPINDGDIVTVDGKVINRLDMVYYLYNKPIGEVCSLSSLYDKTILNSISVDQKIYPVGRLDKESHGLIILTNDGQFCHKVLNSTDHIEKEYRVKVQNEITKEFIKRMGETFILRGKETLIAKIKQISPYEFQIILKEGKYHQIRKMVIASGNRVVDLERIRIGNITLNDLNNESLVEMKDLKEKI